METILTENMRRHELRNAVYNPLSGEGCTGERSSYDAMAWDEGTVKLPCTMLSDPSFSPFMTICDYRRLRYRHDFEYWCYRCVKIKHKVTRRLVTFELNRAQRKLLEALEKQRVAGLPVRVILLKARQWGGSTLVQIYMAWWQIILHTRCHSVICCHVKDASTTIKGMYGTLLDNYPGEAVTIVGE